MSIDDEIMPEVYKSIKQAGYDCIHYYKFGDDCLEVKLSNDIYFTFRKAFDNDEWLDFLIVLNKYDTDSNVDAFFTELNGKVSKKKAIKLLQSIEYLIKENY